MLFLAHINEKDDTQVTTDYDENGEEILTRIFATVAIGQYQISPVEHEKNFTVDGKEKKKTYYAMDERTRVQGQSAWRFDIPLGIQVFDALTVGFQIGAIQKGTIIDLREENWDNMQQDYDQQRGHFAYLKKHANVIK